MISLGPPSFAIHVTRGASKSARRKRLGSSKWIACLTGPRNVDIQNDDLEKVTSFSKRANFGVPFC